MAVNAMMDWDNEFTIYFIQLYRDEPCLWNPSHKDHKVRHKIVDAWQRISDVTRKDVAELKRKRDSLMATFRNHTRKKKKSIIHGEEIYEPIWFAYAPLEAFLGDLYGTNTSKVVSILVELHPIEQFIIFYERWTFHGEIIEFQCWQRWPCNFMLFL